MDDLEGHFCYLDFLLKSNHVGVAHAVSDEQGKQNICRERKIFVKAALQLLDAQEKNVVNSLIVPSLVGAETTDFDIIRSGYLKKGARVSKMIPNMGLSQSKSSYTWKSKYVELRHGEFSYYDEAVEETPLATASLHSYHSQSHSKAAQHAVGGGGAGPSTAGPGPVAAPTGFKKSIPLSPDLCSCRVVQYASGRGAHYQAAHQHSERDDSEAEEATGSGCPATPSDGNFVPGHAFEICLLGGQRRLFLTGSAEESREWVRDIMTAMVGGKAATLELPQDRKMSAAAVPAPELPLKSAGQTARSKAQEGGAGPYAGSITEYLNLQARLHSVREEEAYKAIMRELVDRRARVAVPVAYIKGKCSDNSFSGASTHLHVPVSSAMGHHEGHTPLSLSINALLSGKHRLHHHTGNGKSNHGKAVPPIPASHLGKSTAAAVCVERSQMWKDLQRDEVCVNGECVAGASADGSFPGDASSPAAEASQGAEAIVGLLVRHIADAVDRAKTELQGILVRSQPHTPHASHHVLLQIMTEAQIVQCARSVLMMCNRTQSGGDTYYCVDTLLRRKSAPAADGNGTGGGGYNSDNLFILAPMSNKAEPLTIEVDLVETDRNGFDPEGGGSRLQIQQRAVAAAAFATPTAAVAGRNGALYAEPSPRTDFIDALAATSLGNNGQSSPAVQRTLTADTTDDGLKRRSSRRLHLKLSIDEDTDYYDRERASSFSLYADAATPVAAMNSKGLRSEFVSILEENSSHNSDTTDDRNQPPLRRGGESNVTVSLSGSSKAGSEEEHRGGRAALRLQHPSDAPPLRVLSIDEAALHDEGGDGDVSNNNTPPYLISTRDDSTVISDITFDTTAAFSQHTTIASYHQQTKDVPLGCASDAEVAEVASPPRPGKKSGHHLKGGKALMKMISARLPTKHAMGMGMSFTPGGHAHNFSDHDLSAAASAASQADEQQQGQLPAHGELRPSQSSYGSLQTLTPSRSRGGSSTPAVEHSNGGGGGGNMLSSLFKSERSKAVKAAHAQNQSQDVVQEKDRKVSEKDLSERVVERKACVCVRLRVRGVSRYRVCSADPQGEPEEDNWAAMEGAFSQTFYVPAAVEGDFPSLSAEEEAAALAFGPLPASAMVVAGPVPAALSRLAMTDRVVVISALKCE